MKVIYGNVLQIKTTEHRILQDWSFTAGFLRLLLATSDLVNMPQKLVLFNPGITFYTLITKKTPLTLLLKKWFEISFEYFPFFQHFSLAGVT